MLNIFGSNIWIRRFPQSENLPHQNTKTPNISFFCKWSRIRTLNIFKLEIVTFDNNVKNVAKPWVIAHDSWQNLRSDHKIVPTPTSEHFPNLNFSQHDYFQYVEADFSFHWWTNQKPVLYNENFPSAWSPHRSSHCLLWYCCGLFHWNVNEIIHLMHPKQFSSTEKITIWYDDQSECLKLTCVFDKVRSLSQWVSECKI